MNSLRRLSLRTSTILATVLVAGLHTPSNASFGRHNEQGVSSSHTYTSTGPGEMVSNLNGNLLLSVPLADVATVTLPIRLERSFNSHWRDPLLVEQYDIYAGDGNSGQRYSPDWEYRNDALGPGQVGTFAIGGASGLGHRVRYTSLEREPIPANLAYVLGTITQSAAAGWQIAQLGTAASNSNVLQGKGSAWASLAFSAASMSLQVMNWNDRERRPHGTEEEAIATLRFATSLAQATVAIARISGNKGATKALAPLAVVGFALHLYDYAKFANRQDPWDPGGDQATTIAQVSLMLDFIGTAALFACPPVGGVILLVSALVDLANALYMNDDLKRDKLDAGEVRVNPWALAVNGYVGLMGANFDEDRSRRARPFGGFLGANLSTGEGVNEASNHPMSELFLVRSGGGADKFLLAPHEYIERDGARWYGYVAGSRANRTEVLYRDFPPYENERITIVAGLPKGGVVDPNDYYLVREPDGTTACFGAGGTKGIDRVSSQWGSVWEAFWALPNSVRHWSGDSIVLERSGQSQGDLALTAVRHSRDARWVRVTSTMSGQDLTRETVDEIGSGGTPVRSVSTDWAPEAFYHGRSQDNRVNMLRAVSVPVEDGNRTTRFEYLRGNLVKTQYPDGSQARYSWGTGRNKTFTRYSQDSPMGDDILNVLAASAVSPALGAGVAAVTIWQGEDGDTRTVDESESMGAQYDGFLAERVQEGAPGQLPRRLVQFGYTGWVANEPQNPGQILTTTVQTHLVQKEPSGDATVRSRTDWYRFRLAGDSVLVRHNPRHGYTPEETAQRDTALERMNAHKSVRLQIETALLGVEGLGSRTDYLWHGDRLIGTIARAGRDTAFTPRITLTSYDEEGHPIVVQENPSAVMEKFEQTLLLSTSKALKEGRLDSSNLDWEALRQEYETTTGRAFRGQFLALDRIQTMAWRHENRANFWHDTSWIGPNPYRARDSVKVWRDDSLFPIQMQERLAAFVNDSTCVVRGRNSEDPGDCGLFQGQTDSALEAGSLVLREEVATKIAEWPAIRASRDSLWQRMDTLAVLHYRFRNDSLFDPRGRFVEGLPIAQFVYRKHPDTAALLSQMMGSAQVLDTALRVVRTDVFGHGIWRVAARYAYLDPSNRWVPTQTRQIVDSVPGGKVYASSRIVLDPLTHTVPIEQQIWTGTDLETAPPVSVTDPLAPSRNPDLVSYTRYDDRLRPNRSIGPRGDTTQVSYDLLDRVVGVSLPGGTRVGRAFAERLDAQGLLWTTDTSESGMISRTGVDALGRMRVGEVHPSSGTGAMRRTTYEYDLFGVSTVVDPLGRTARVFRDPMGRTVVTEIARASGGAFRWETRYDDFRQRVTSVDPLGRATWTQLDLDGNPLEIRRVIGPGDTATTRMRYDNLGKLVWTQSPAGDTTGIVRNPWDQIDEQSTSQGRLTRLHHDWRGQVLASFRSGPGVGPRGVASVDSSATNYDALGRVLRSQRIGDSRSLQELAYDTATVAGIMIREPGQLLRVRLGTGVEARYLTNVRGSLLQRVLEHRSPDGDTTFLDTLTYRYAADQKRTEQLLPGGAKVTYTYTPFDELDLALFVDPTGKSHDLNRAPQYDAAGDLRQTKAGSIQVRHQYDADRGLWTGLSAWAGTDTLVRLRDSFDLAGRLNHRVRPSGEQVAYTWDGLERLAGVRYESGRFDGKPNLNYAYNANGVRTGLDHDYGKLDWTLAPGTNQAVGRTGNLWQTQGWDGRGQRLRDATYPRASDYNSALVGGTAPAADTTWVDEKVYTWTASGELERFRSIEAKPAGILSGRDTTNLALVSGEDGQIVSRWKASEIDGSDTTWTLNRRLVVEGFTPVAWADSSGRWNYRVPTATGMAEVYEDSLGRWRVVTPLTDRTGSVVALVNDSGRVLARYNWGPYGELEDYQGERQTDWGIYGKEWVPEIGLVQMGMRWYSPEDGQFLTEDPLGQFWNPFAYTGGDPLTIWDPTGLMAATASENAAGNGCIDPGIEMDLGSTRLTPFNIGGVQDATRTMTAIRVAPSLPDPGKLSAAPPISMPSVDFVESPVNTLLFGIPADLKTAFSYASQGRTKDWTKVWAKATAKGLVFAVAGPIFDRTVAAAGREVTVGTRATTDFLSDVTVTSRGNVVGRGIVDLRGVLRDISSGRAAVRDVFKNREGLLPSKPQGYYQEFVVPTPGVKGAGSQRIVRGDGGELYYTPNHYETFIPLN